jgi:hypothetical protein
MLVVLMFCNNLLLDNFEEIILLGIFGDLCVRSWGCNCLVMLVMMGLLLFELLIEGKNLGFGL